MAKKKKSALKPVANRGFATTSTPGKRPAEIKNADKSEELGVGQVDASEDQPSAKKAVLYDDFDILQDGLRKADDDDRFDPKSEEEQVLQNVVDRLREKVDKDVSRFWKAIEFDRRQARQLPIFDVDVKLQESILNEVLQSQEDVEQAPKSSREISDLLSHVGPSTAANELLHKAMVTHALLLRLGFSPKQATSALSSCQSVTDVDDCVAWLSARLSSEELDLVERRCDGRESKVMEKSGEDDQDQDDSDFSVDESRPPSHPAFAFERVSSSQHQGSFASQSGTSGLNTPTSNNNSGTATPSAELSASAKHAIDEGKLLCEQLLRGLDDRDLVDTLEQPILAYARARLASIRLEKSSGALEKLCKSFPDSSSLPLAEVRRKFGQLRSKSRGVISECLVSPKWNNAAGEAQFRSIRSTWEEEEEAKRKASHAEGIVDDARESSISGMDDILDTAHVLAEASLQSDEEDDDSAGLFGDLLDEQADEIVDGNTQTTVKLRDLPPQALKSQGSKAPRNLLLEALRRKDPSASLRFEVVSTGGKMFRSRMTMRWLKGQVDVYTMTGMATLSQNSADDMLALAALLCVDAKAEKTLGNGFREWWLELSECRQEERDTASRHQFKRILIALGERLEQANVQAEETKRSMKALTSNGSGKAHLSLTPQESDAESWNDSQAVDRRGQELWKSRENSKGYKQMLASRQNLPIAAFKAHIIDTLDNNQVTVLNGETGCGKSTQLPAYIVENKLSQGIHCKVLVTEPRRISAISLAERVSAELGEPRHTVGKHDSLIGSAVRLENNIGRSARLIYATTGIVLRMLEDGDLEGITHIIVDEVHERSIESDFLLIILKQLMAVKKELKVVLMSATLDAERFSEYFGGCPTIHVPGRTFPVEVCWLEDAVEACGYVLEEGSQYARRRNHRNFDVNNKAKLAIARTDGEGDDDELIDGEEDEVQEVSASLKAGRYKAKTVSTLDRMDEYAVNHELIIALLEQMCFGPEHLQAYSAATLVFLPGIADIRRLNDLLLSHKKFGTQSFQVWPLHSTITSENQSLVFEIPPEGVRKIVLSTNIAETGITIPDITCVIDSGKHREMRFDEKRQLSKLVECFVARSNAKQRRGRAGRVQNGICWHLFTRHRHDQLLAEHSIPEILRLSLQDLSLKLKVMKIKIGSTIEDALSKALDAPSSINIQRAVASLVEVKALLSNEEITALGRQLSRLPLDVYMAKFLLNACSLRVLDSALTIAATLNAKSPFLTPFGRELEARAVKKSFDAGDNDFVAIVRAFNAWRRATENGVGKQFCQKCFLSLTNLIQIEELRQQYLTYLIDAGFVPVDDATRKEIVGGHFRFSHGGSKSRFVRVPDTFNVHGTSLAQLNAAIVSALYPKLLVIDGRNGALKTLTNNAPASIHPSSVNFKLRLDALPRSVHHLVYFTIMQSRRLYAWETAAVEERAILLLCGEADFKFSSTSLYVDRQRVRVTFYDRKMQLALRTIRQRFVKLLHTSYRSPGKGWDQDDERLFDLVCQFLGVNANEKDKVVV